MSWYLRGFERKYPKYFKWKVWHPNDLCYVMLFLSSWLKNNYGCQSKERIEIINQRLKRVLIVNYSPTYVLRSKGFDVHTKEKTNGSVQEWISRQHSFDIWENIDGTTAKPTLNKDWLINKGYKQMTPKRYLEFYEETTKETGNYIITIG